MDKLRRGWEFPEIGFAFLFSFFGLLIFGQETGGIFYIFSLPKRLAFSMQ